MTVLVGGVSQLYQGDHDLGRVAVQMLQREDLGRDVLVEDLYYGAVAVVQRLQELSPDTLILLGAHERGRPPGTVERRLLEPPSVDPERVQRSVEDAVTGYVNLDIAIDVIGGLGVQPPRTIIVEVEPSRTEPSEELSEEAREALPHVISIVRTEARRAPLFELATKIRDALDEPRRLEVSPALEVLEELLAELRAAEIGGTWGATFKLRDRLRLAIAAGDTGEGMTHLDWGLWWALIEELERLQAGEVA